MPAVVTDTPILIDPIGYSRQSNAEINPLLFPYSIINIYTGLARNIPVSPQLANAVNPFKSTDAAATWTIEDDANSPGHRDSWWSERSGIIKAAVIDTFANITVTAFDTVTDTWGTPSAQFTLPDFPKNEGAVLIDKPNGDTVYFWCDQTTQALNCAVLNSGVWSSLMTLINFGVGSGFLMGGVIQSDGTVHLVKGRGSDSVMSYIRISDGLVADSPVDIGFEDGLRVDLRIFDSSIAIASTSPIDNATHVTIGAPLSAPVFTDYVVETATGTATVVYASLAVDLTGGLNAFWGYWDYGGPSPYIDEIHQSTFDGISAWSTPILFYDAVTNPPANDVAPIDQFIHTMQIPDQFSNGQWLPYIGMEVTIVPGGGEACAGFIVSSPATVALSITCPTGSDTATLGELFTSNPPEVIGGVPPYVYVLLSGPGWMSIDPDTGIVSGIPDATGTVTYVIQVTDSLSATADTSPGCDLLITSTPLTITCPVGGNVATVGVPYSAQIVVTGGTPPYTFRLLP